MKQGNSKRVTRRTFALIAAAAFGFFVGLKILWPEALTSRVVIPRGAVLTVRLDHPISSRTARLGDEFEGHIVSTRGVATTARTLAGASVVGRCVAVRDGYFESGYLRLALSGLKDGWHVAPLDTSTVSLWGQPGMSSEGGPPEPIKPLEPAPKAEGSLLPHSLDGAVTIRPEQGLDFVVLSPAAVAPR